MQDRLTAIQAFVAVCDAEGFSLAARRLNLAPSVVTRLVAGLEQRLGARLLQRTTRAVMLTDAGARFLARARRILSEVEEAELWAQGERAEPTGKLVITAPLLFGRLHVAPLLLKFRRAYPRVRLELRLSDRMVNLIEEGVDIAVRIGELTDSGLAARRLGRTQRWLVASPSYLRERALPLETPSQLANHLLIGFDALTSSRQWKFLGPSGESIAISLEPHFVTNNADVALDHAIAGGGITTALSYQVIHAIEAGSLVEVLPQFAPHPIPIHAVFPTSRLLASTVRAYMQLAGEAGHAWDFIDRDRIIRPQTAPP